MSPEPEPEPLDLFERRPPTPAPVSSSRAPVPLWPAEPTRNSMVICGVCQRENHETRQWCIRCGHAIGVPLSQCVCEACLQPA